MTDPVRETSSRSARLVRFLRQKVRAREPQTSSRCITMHVGCAAAVVPVAEPDPALPVAVVDSAVSSVSETEVVAAAMPADLASPSLEPHPDISTAPTTTSRTIPLAVVVGRALIAPAALILRETPRVGAASSEPSSLVSSPAGTAVQAVPGPRARLGIERRRLSCKHGFSAPLDTVAPLRSSRAPRLGQPPLRLALSSRAPLRRQSLPPVARPLLPPPRRPGRQLHRPRRGRVKTGPRSR
jgi:hypothetical protein